MRICLFDTIVCHLVVIMRLSWITAPRIWVEDLITYLSTLNGYATYLPLNLLVLKIYSQEGKGPLSPGPTPSPLAL